MNEPSPRLDSSTWFNNLFFSRFVIWFLVTNLIAIVEQQYKNFNIWIDIPFPQGYNYQNSIILLQHFSSNTSGFCNLKIHDNNRQFCANAINTAIETIPVQFVFIKKYN